MDAGACASLEELELFNVKDDKEGVKALAEAFKKGAAPKLHGLNMDSTRGNDIGIDWGQVFAARPRPLCRRHSHDLRVRVALAS